MGERRAKRRQFRLVVKQLGSEPCVREYTADEAELRMLLDTFAHRVMLRALLAVRSASTARGAAAAAGRCCCS